MENNKDWKDIHKDFGEKNWNDKTFQQTWEEKGLTYQDAKEWIAIGFKPRNYNEVKHWKNHAFTPQEARAWKEVGLDEDKRDYEFAAYLRVKNIQPNQAKGNLEELKKEFNTWLEKEKPAQEYLNAIFPKEKRNKITELDIRNKKLTEVLDLSDFVNLEILECSENNLTSLNLDNCLNLTDLNIYNNNFNQDLSVFSKFVNLERLWIGNNYFTGSLEPLKNLSKLKYLNIEDTDIDSGLEYLPDSLEEFWCSADERKDAKCKVIEETYRHFNQDLKKLRESINSPVRKWLNENYPENGVCQRETKDKGLDSENGWNNKGKKRADIEKLDISKQSLAGGLWLKGFTSLEILNCSNNQLTDLVLSDCKRLKEILMQNNQKISQSLDFFSSLKELTFLDISNCSFGGSLKPLKDLNKLGMLVISNTNLSEGLEHLPKSCKMFFCNSVYPHQSTKLMEELESKKCFENEDVLEKKYNETKSQALKKILDTHHKKYYIPEKWKRNKDNDAIASTIPLERLFVIGDNMEHFANKWGDCISELKPPKELISYKYLGLAAQWGSRATAVTGGILALADQPMIGGIMAASSPFVDAAAEETKNFFYDNNEKKWNEFVDDVNKFLKNHCELLGILKMVKDKDLGRISIALKDLRRRNDSFLNAYDTEDGNKRISIKELTEKERKELVEDLDKSKKGKLWMLINAVNKLAEEVANYKQGINEEETQDELTKKLEELKGEEIKLILANRKNVEKMEEKDQKELLNAYQQIEYQLVEEKENLLFLKKQGKLTNEESELLKKLEVILSKIEQRIDVERLKEQKSQLKKELKDYQQEKQTKESSQKKQPTDEEEELLKEIKRLEESIKAEQKEANIIKNEKIKKQQVRSKFVELENQIKELASTDYWSKKFKQGWKSAKQGTYYNTIEFLENILTVPVWYWEQWKEKENPVIIDDEIKENIQESEAKSPIQAENWLEKGKRLLFCGTKDENEPSIREQLSLDNSEKDLEIKEIIKDLESKEQIIDIDEHFTKKDEIKPAQLTKEETQQEPKNQETPQEANSEQKAWQNQDFTEEQTKQWIEAGLTSAEANFAAWLRDIKSKDLENYADPNWIKEKITTGELNLNELRKEYKQEKQEIKIDMQAQIIQPPKGGNN